jgi:integrase
LQAYINTVTFLVRTVTVSSQYCGKQSARNARPNGINVTVDRPVRPREYLTEREIEKLIKAAGENRWGHRDATAILIAYRHGLRASELVALRWDDIDFQTGKLHVRRARAARPAFTRSEAENYAPCGG